MSNLYLRNFYIFYLIIKGSLVVQVDKVYGRCGSTENFTVVQLFDNEKSSDESEK